MQQARGEPKFIVCLRLAGVFCARKQGLGRGNICRLCTKPLPVKHPITMQPVGIENLVYLALCSKRTTALRASLRLVLRLLGARESGVCDEQSRRRRVLAENSRTCLTPSRLRSEKGCMRAWARLFKGWITLSTG